MAGLAGKKEAEKKGAQAAVADNWLLCIWDEEEEEALSDTQLLPAHDVAV